MYITKWMKLFSHAWNVPKPPEKEKLQYSLGREGKGRGVSGRCEVLSSEWSRRQCGVRSMSSV